MFAQYSPLFTSGLLSDSSPAPSPLPNSRRRKAAHDSLPLTVRSSEFSVYSPSHSHSPYSASESSEDALYLTLKPSRRQLEHGQSFLSLDLSADMHRSMSLRRKDTVTTARGRSVPTSPVMSAPPMPRSFSPLLRRSSREGLPRPKPAPSATLPDVPVPVPAARHRPSRLTLSFSSFMPDAEIAVAGPSSSTTAPSSTRHRMTNSEPSAISPSLRSSPILDFDLETNEYHSYFTFSPTFVALATPPLTGTSDVSDGPVEPISAPVSAKGPTNVNASSGYLKATPSFRSTASVATRQRNRSAALAALEGRGANAAAGAGAGKRRMSIKRNFMSMSDDEDDDDDEVDEREIEKQLLGLGVLAEEEDVGVPTIDWFPPSSSSAFSLSPAKENKRGSKSPSASGSSTSETRRSRRTTLESFLAPLTNFMDLREDEAGKSWRSFVEIA